MGMGMGQDSAGRSTTNKPIVCLVTFEGHKESAVIREVADAAKARRVLGIDEQVEGGGGEAGDGAGGREQSISSSGRSARQGGSRNWQGGGGSESVTASATGGDLGDRGGGGRRGETPRSIDPQQPSPLGTNTGGASQRHGRKASVSSSETTMMGIGGIGGIAGTGGAGRGVGRSAARPIASRPMAIHVAGLGGREGGGGGGDDSDDMSGNSGGGGSGGNRGLRSPLTLNTAPTVNVAGSPPNGSTVGSVGSPPSPGSSMAVNAARRWGASSAKGGARGRGGGGGGGGGGGPSTRSEGFLFHVNDERSLLKISLWEGAHTTGAFLGEIIFDLNHLKDGRAVVETQQLQGRVGKRDQVEQGSLTVCLRYSKTTVGCMRALIEDSGQIEFSRYGPLRR